MKAIEENPGGVKKADIVVGIPSYNEASLIEFPTSQAALGLKEYFKDFTSVIINCDNNSNDGTGKVFMNTDTFGIPKIYLSTPKGIRGKGNNFKNLFRKVLELEAQAVVVVDADLKSITPRWIKNLGEPLFNDFGYVAPLYVRHKYDGTITNNIAYPLTRCLYGRRVRQPIGGDFGFSGRMAGLYMKSQLWNEDVSQFGIDIWMTTIAMNEGVPICQAFMGRPKVHKPKDPASDLGPMFRQVIGTMFNLMDAYHEKWGSTKWSKPTAIFGFGLGEVEMPPPVEVNKEKLYEKFREGFNSYWDIYRTIFSSENLQKIREISSLSLDHFEMPVTVWAKSLFDFANSYHHNTIDRNKLIEVLIPLYYGMTLSFVNKTEGMSIQQAEEFLEDMCLVFEQTKPYIIDRWNQ
ncbi:MAG TPA: glycosyl transferase [Deltaproteobacteria bacterium]|nr:glycosyl transferase [Deltaproteobacteria bacterium]